MDAYYQDGCVSIYHGDAREILPELPQGFIATDPPYNVGYHYDQYADKLGPSDYAALIKETCLFPCVVIHYPEDICELSLMLGASPSKFVAWVYNSNTPRQWRGVAWWGMVPNFNADGQSYKNPNDPRIAARIANGEMARLYDWWEIDQVKNVSAEKTSHPCQIPINLMRRVLRISEPALVIDPFLGSGTTLAAAKDLGIKAIGVDVSEAYCELAAKRLSQGVLFQ